MTLTSDERAALERRLGFDHYYEMERGDSKLLAAALRREHPADEDEPIDEAFLRSVGFKDWPTDDPDMSDYDLFTPMKDELGWKCRLAYQSNGFYAVRMCEDEELGYSESVELLGSRNRFPAVTRGQLRSLAAVLGIDLREGK